MCGTATKQDAAPAALSFHCIHPSSWHSPEPLPAAAADTPALPPFPSPPQEILRRDELETYDLLGLSSSGAYTQQDVLPAVGTEGSLGPDAYLEPSPPAGVEPDEARASAARWPEDHRNM